MMKGMYMLRVYRVKTDVDHFQYFLTEHTEDAEKLRMDCSSRENQWSPPSVYIYKPLNRHGDFYNFGSSGLIMSPRATTILRPHLLAAGELLPLPYQGEIFSALNVTECVNCLDHDRTEWITRGLSSMRIGIKQYAFYKDRFPESDIFKIPETRLSEILVVDGFKDPKDGFKAAVEANNLEGLIFEQIWEG